MAKAQCTTPRAIANPKGNDCPFGPGSSATRPPQPIFALSKVLHLLAQCQYLQRATSRSALRCALRLAEPQKAVANPKGNNCPFGSNRFCYRATATKSFASAKVFALIGLMPTFAKGDLKVRLASRSALCQPQAMLYNKAKQYQLCLCTKESRVTLAVARSNSLG